MGKAINTAPSLTPQVNRAIIQAPEKLPEREASFLPMLHGKATDELVKMSGKPVTQNKLNNTGIVESGEVKLVLDKINQLTGTLGVSTHKLLSTAIAQFTALNHT